MTDPAVASCVFCGGEAPAPVRIDRFGVSSCMECAARVGQLVLLTPSPVLELWPMLKESEDEELEPEPKVRRGDGTVVELREMTAELKRELPVEKRMDLADSYGVLGLLREQLLECGFVLGAATTPELAQRAMDVLFSRPLYRAKDLETLRGRLFPA